MLKASKRSCRLLLSPIGMLFARERSRLATCELLRLLRPTFPNEPTGDVKAHGLNQLAAVYTASAALPPWEIVEWQAGSGFAATGPGVNGSAIWFGRE